MYTYIYIACIYIYIYTHTLKHIYIYIYTHYMMTRVWSIQWTGTLVRSKARAPCSEMPRRLHSALMCIIRM